MHPASPSGLLTKWGDQRESGMCASLAGWLVILLSKMLHKNPWISYLSHWSRTAEHHPLYTQCLSLFNIPGQHSHSFITYFKVFLALIRENSTFWIKMELRSYLSLVRFVNTLSDNNVQPQVTLLADVCFLFEWGMLYYMTYNKCFKDLPCHTCRGHWWQISFFIEIDLSP